MGRKEKRNKKEKRGERKINEDTKWGEKGSKNSGI